MNWGMTFSMSVVLPLLGRPTTPRTTGAPAVLAGRTSTPASVSPPSRRCASTQSAGVFTLKNGAVSANGTRATRYEREEVQDAVRTGVQQVPHVRQAAGAVHGVQRLEVVLGHGQRDIDAVEAPGKHAPDRFGIGRDEVGGHGEHGLVEPVEDGGEPGQRGARHLVGDDDGCLRGRPRPAPARRFAPTGLPRGTTPRRKARLRCSSVSPPSAQARACRGPWRRASPPASRTPIRTRARSVVWGPIARMECSSCVRWAEAAAGLT